jgi:cell division transport system ATP-binding protein
VFLLSLIINPLIFLKKNSLHVKFLLLLVDTPNIDMIQMAHVFKTFPNRISALSDISLEILPGEFVYIAGPSGSGKTTLLRILFCAEKPTGGEVTVNEFHITQQGFSKVYQLRRTMGIVFQDAKLLQDRTANENVAFALETIGQFQKEVKKKVSEILTQVGLQERGGEPIITLSAGEQQRVAIARALVNDPPLLLVDEPTGNLDAQITTDVMKIFSQLHQKGTTVVFATQNTDLIRRYPYRVIQILGGRRVDGETGEEGRAEA